MIYFLICYRRRRRRRRRCRRCRLLRVIQKKVNQQCSSVLSFGFLACFLPKKRLRRLFASLLTFRPSYVCAARCCVRPFVRVGHTQLGVMDVK